MNREYQWDANQLYSWFIVTLLFFPDSKENINLQIPATHLCGEEGKAYKYALQKLAEGRICAGVQVYFQENSSSLFFHIVLHIHKCYIISIYPLAYAKCIALS